MENILIIFILKILCIVYIHMSCPVDEKQLGVQQQSVEALDHPDVIPDSSFEEAIDALVDQFGDVLHALRARLSKRVQQDRLTMPVTQDSSILKSTLSLPEQSQVMQDKSGQVTVASIPISQAQAPSPTVMTNTVRTMDRISTIGSSVRQLKLQSFPTMTSAQLQERKQEPTKLQSFQISAPATSSQQQVSLT